MAALRLSRAFPGITAPQFLSSSRLMHLATQVLEGDVVKANEAVQNQRRQIEEARSNANWYANAMDWVARGGKRSV